MVGKNINISLIFNVLLGALVVYNSYLLINLRRERDLLQSRVYELENSRIELKEGLIKAHHAAIRHYGKRLVKVSLKPASPQGGEVNCNLGEKLILVFSDIGCDACLNSERYFINGIADTFGKDKVMAIVSSEDKRYIYNYVRVNKPHFPVYQSENNSFGKKNQIDNSPILLLTDKSGVVVASHFPIPGQPEYSAPFHNFCMQYFLKHQN